MAGQVAEGGKVKELNLKNPQNEANIMKHAKNYMRIRGKYESACLHTCLYAAQRLQSG